MKLQICFVIDNDNYKDNARKIDRKDSGMQEHLYKHFQTEGHKGFLIETSVTFIDETDEKGQKKRERERYWMRTLWATQSNLMGFILQVVCSRLILYFACLLIIIFSLLLFL